MPQQFDLDFLKNAMMGNGMRENNAKRRNEHKKNNNKSGNYKSKSGKSNSHKQTGYVGAPYNFVPFTDHVYEYPETKQVWHDDISKELLTGTIEYEITANTPIIVDDGTGNFYQTAQGTYAIPGSTVRGLIRSNVQILGLSGFSSDIDNYALMYRNIASGAEKKYYNEILGAKQITIDNGDKKQKVGVLTNVKAGYIVNEHGSYKIYQTIIDSIKKNTDK